MSLELQCPLPLHNYPTVTMGHGGGGRLSQQLIEGMLRPALSNPALDALHDGARLALGGEQVAFTTDSYVISPLFFPGGDIGALAIHGTINDLAMCGAQPLALAVGLIIEEGLPMETLWRVVQSMQAAAREAGVAVVTGDTKVVERGKGDGIFINTSGIGLIPPGIVLDPRRAAPGDHVLLSGPIANHGIAIMSVREGLAFETALESDSAALHGLVAGLLEAVGTHVHVLRDPTRGGVASALNEIAQAAGVGMSLDEAAIPLDEAVRGACEMLGLDPLYVANEGKCLAIVAPEQSEAALASMRAHPLGQSAAIIGHVNSTNPGRVTLRSRIGGSRVVDMLSGEQLPRIC
ncbi:hydrogenase expression/formation protein HypE [Candidatus Viridilinea mediisalina]|uniref:Hydrogenase expression/formation protein HypE n=1 Tax=Candidatus Viridilinea mediisalina TaxID=2024553 RepID=A0A2A6RJW1_9CHLR|nr:hydrogenase expression/formation protein HypE [Candidatus Viridilinea mediisalina]PDW03185.1 hydrogenase expression/formation protein HypE [Candidatus Viridilinea mediisalina]